MTDPMLIERATLVGIADIVREKEGTEDDVPVAELEERLRAIAESGGGGTPKVCFPDSSGDFEITSLTTDSTGVNYTLVMTITNFPANGKLVGLYCPKILEKSDGYFFDLVYSPSDDNTYQGFWSGISVMFLFDGGTNSRVSYELAGTTLTVTAVLKGTQSTSWLGFSEGTYFGTLHYIYTEG